MADKKQTTKARTDAENSPVVWLTVYEAATRQGNAALAEQARRELEQRGVILQEAAR